MFCKWECCKRPTRLFFIYLKCKMFYDKYNPILWQFYYIIIISLLSFSYRHTYYYMMMIIIPLTLLLWFYFIHSITMIIIILLFYCDYSVVHLLMMIVISSIFLRRLLFHPIFYNGDYYYIHTFMMFINTRQIQTGNGVKSREYIFFYKKEMVYIIHTVTAQVQSINVSKSN